MDRKPALWISCRQSHPRLSPDLPFPVPVAIPLHQTGSAFLAKAGVRRCRQFHLLRTRRVRNCSLEVGHRIDGVGAVTDFEMQEGGGFGTHHSNTLAAFHFVALGHFDVVDIGVDCQDVVGMADNQN